MVYSGMETVNKALQQHVTELNAMPLPKWVTQIRTGWLTAVLVALTLTAASGTVSMTQTLWKLQSNDTARTEHEGKVDTAITQLTTLVTDMRVKQAEDEGQMHAHWGYGQPFAPDLPPARVR